MKQQRFIINDNNIYDMMLGAKLPQQTMEEYGALYNFKNINDFVNFLNKEEKINRKIRKDIEKRLKEEGKLK